MLVKSPLQIAMDAILANKGTIWLTGSQPENKDKYAEILFRTRPSSGIGKNIKIVCGELSPLLFNDEKVLDAVDWALSEGAEIGIIFHRGNSAEEGLNRLRQTNPHFYERLLTKKERLTLYWSPIRMKQHFLAISNSGVLLERPGTDKEQNDWWAYFVKDSKLAQKWLDKFEQYLNTGRLVRILSPN